MEISSTQKFFKFFVSNEKFEKMKSESMLWVFQCDCGNEFSIWEARGIRNKARGEPLKIAGVRGVRLLP